MLGGEPVPNKTELVIGGAVVWLVVGFCVSLICGADYHMARMIWAVLSLLISAGFAVKLKKPTEARWGIVLVLACLTLPHVVSVVVVSYLVWAYYRWQKSKLSAAEQIVETGEAAIAPDKLRNFFAGIHLGYFAFWFVFSIVMAIIAAFLMTTFWFKSKDTLLFTNIVCIVNNSLLLFWVLGKTEKYNISLEQLFGSPPKRFLWPKVLFLVVFAGLLGAGIDHLVLYWESFLFPSHVQEILSYHPLRSTAGQLPTFLRQIVFGLIVAFLGPVMEELIFRGIILQRLAMRWGINKAIVGSSIFFGILHGDDGGIGAFVFGVILSVLYIKTRTLLIPIIVHMLNNIIAYGFLWFSLIYQQADTIEQLRTDIWSGIGFIVVSLPVVCYYLWKNWPGAGAELPLAARKAAYAE